MIEKRVEEAIQDRVSAAVSELTEKYDFIINKLVTAVDTEFTLLNNKIKFLEASYGKLDK